MERKFEYVTITSNDSNSSKWKYSYHHVREIGTISDGDFWSTTYKCFHYTDEEREENMLYGNQDHEAYLLSDDYDNDCRSEQWDWLKNERG